MPVCNISAESGEGVDRLSDQLLRMFGFDGWSDRDPSLFSQRQVDDAASALSALDEADMAAFDVALAAITGL